ncbi:MAG TPA: choice-of-anchor Q domain-containing protein, partial [Flavisolibacter sp.]|nr:choice-of-anchor Q domain-containing protein [Flavisolibacter sp.]
NYAIIKNAYQGIVVVDPAPSGTKLTLNESIIENAYDVGLGAINSSITARNLLISNCGQNVALTGGGTYNFTHCTIASFSNTYVPHKKPVLYLSDFYNQNGAPIVRNLNAIFTNCIFWGEANGFVDNEVLDTIRGASRPIFQHVLWRMKTVSAKLVPTGKVLNEDPQFDSINTSRRFYNFRLDKGRSRAIDNGTNAGVTVDLDGRPRPVGLPDLGAYEKQ